MSKQFLFFIKSSICFNYRATDYHVFLNFENWLINKKVKDIFVSRFHLVCGLSLGDFYIEKKGMLAGQKYLKISRID